MFKHLIRGASHVVISTHIIPDADGIGSQIALCLALRELNIDAICVNEEPLLERYNYLDADQVVISIDEYQSRPKKEIDLFIVVDTNSPNRIGSKCQAMLEKSKKFLFIDHHPCNPAVEAIHCIDTTKAATGQLVGDLIRNLNLKFNEKMALPLYTSILIDTSSFRYPTVTGDTHKLLAELLDTGIEPPNAYNAIYGFKKASHMHLLGQVLSTTRTNKDGKVAWLTVEEDWVDKYDSDHEDTHGFINHLLILENVMVACMFRNQGDVIKVSFRSDGIVDVGEIAQALGGGGHNHSAATIIEGKLEKVIPEVIKKIELILKIVENR